MPSPAPLVLDWLSRLARGETTVDAVALQLSTLGYSNGEAKVTPPGIASSVASGNEMASIGGATVDLGRPVRCGFGEVIYGEGKPSELIIRIIQQQLRAGQRVLVTRVDEPVAVQVRHEFPMARFNSTARTIFVASTASHSPMPLADSDLSNFDLNPIPHVAVVTAGSTDGPVAEEAIETLAWMKVPYQRFEDIGVAGPQRLLMAVPRLRLASAVVVIAGMEGALPAAVAGHLAVPIIAVPTSVGYGANLGGLTTLLGMLSSCAASVSVVNIDAGFKGGYVAGMIVNQLQRLMESVRVETALPQSRGDAS